MSWVLTLLGPQSRFGDKLLIIRVNCPQIWECGAKGVKCHDEVTAELTLRVTGVGVRVYIYRQKSGLLGLHPCTKRQLLHSCTTASSVLIYHILLVNKDRLEINAVQNIPYIYVQRQSGAAVPV